MTCARPRKRAFTRAAWAASGGWRMISFMTSYLVKGTGWVVVGGVGGGRRGRPSSPAAGPAGCQRACARAGGGPGAATTSRGRYLGPPPLRKRPRLSFAPSHRGGVGRMGPPGSQCCPPRRRSHGKRQLRSTGGMAATTAPTAPALPLNPPCAFFLAPGAEEEVVGRLGRQPESSQARRPAHCRAERHGQACGQQGPGCRAAGGREAGNFRHGGRRGGFRGAGGRGVPRNARPQERGGEDDGSGCQRPGRAPRADGRLCEGGQGQARRDDPCPALLGRWRRRGSGPAQSQPLTKLFYLPLLPFPWRPTAWPSPCWPVCWPGW